MGFEIFNSIIDFTNIALQLLIVIIILQIYIFFLKRLTEFLKKIFANRIEMSSNSNTYVRISVAIYYLSIVMIAFVVINYLIYPTSTPSDDVGTINVWDTLMGILPFILVWRFVVHMMRMFEKLRGTVA